MKPLITFIALAPLLLPLPAQAAEIQKSTLLGIMVGEVVCSLTRANARLDVIESETKRVTKNLYLSGILKAKDMADFKRTVVKVVESCPDDDEPDARN